MAGHPSCVLALPAEPGTCCERFFNHRRRVNEYLYITARICREPRASDLNRDLMSSW